MNWNFKILEELSEVEISNLPGNEFKFGRRMDEHRNLARS